MKPANRWTLAIILAVVIGIALFLWSRREAPQAPATGVVAVQPAASKPEPAPQPAPAEQPAANEPLSVTVQFDYNRSAVRPEEAARLDDLAAKLKDRAYDRLEVSGHADRIGGDAYNLALSRLRAAAVRDYLAGKGVDARRVRADARGEGEPVSGEACRNMGPENRNNRKLIECLRPDRRTEVRLPAQ